MTAEPLPLGPVADALVVFVAGRPAPQGSKRARPIYRGKGAAREFTGKVAQVDMSGESLKTWRDDIRAALLGDDGLPRRRFGAVAMVVRLEFRLSRPQSHYRTGRNAHLLRDAAPRHPAGKPDIDKTSRAVLDAITSAGVWADDSQVVELYATKAWAESGETAGCRITVSESP